MPFDQSYYYNLKIIYLLSFRIIIFDAFVYNIFTTQRLSNLKGCNLNESQQKP